jgi:polar amino acid transport system substrate-binding protein
VFLLATIFVSVNAIAANCDVITMTGNPEYAPVTWKTKDGGMKGAYIEYTQKLLSELGYKSKAKAMGNWQRAQSMVKKGKIDMLIGPWFNTEREKWLEYVQPEVSLDPAVVFVNVDKEFDYKEFSDLKGKRGTMQRGNSYGEAFDQYASKNLTIELVNTWPAAFKKLALSRADYIPAGLYVGQLEIEKLGLTDKLKALPRPITKDKMFIAFSKQSVCKNIAAEMTSLIVKYTKSGVIEQLTSKYLKEYVLE